MNTLINTFLPSPVTRENYKFSCTLLPNKNSSLIKKVTALIVNILLSLAVLPLLIALSIDKLRQRVQPISLLQIACADPTGEYLPQDVLSIFRSFALLDPEEQDRVAPRLKPLYEQYQHYLREDPHRELFLAHLPRNELPNEHLSEIPAQIPQDDVPPLPEHWQSDLAFLANAFGDEFSGSQASAMNRLEHRGLPQLISYLRQRGDIENPLLPALEAALRINQSYQLPREEAIAAIQLELRQAIERQQPILIPSGYNGNPGHAIMLELIPINRFRAHLRIFNAGEGATLKHQCITIGHQTKVQALLWLDIELRKFTSPLFAETLWSLQHIPEEISNKSPVRICMVYEMLQEALQPKRQRPDPACVVRAQRSGTCQTASLFAAIKPRMPLQDFRRLKIDLLIHSLELLGNQPIESESQSALLHRSHLFACRKMLSLQRKGIIGDRYITNAEQRFAVLRDNLNTHRNTMWPHIGLSPDLTAERSTECNIPITHMRAQYDPNLWEAVRACDLTDPTTAFAQLQTISRLLQDSLRQNFYFSVCVAALDMAKRLPLDSTFWNRMCAQHTSEEIIAFFWELTNTIVLSGDSTSSSHAQLYTLCKIAHILQTPLRILSEFSVKVYFKSDRATRDRFMELHFPSLDHKNKILGGTDDICFWDCQMWQEWHSALSPHSQQHTKTVYDVFPEVGSPITLSYTLQAPVYAIVDKSPLFARFRNSFADYEISEVRKERRIQDYLNSEHIERIAPWLKQYENIHTHAMTAFVKVLQQSQISLHPIAEIAGGYNRTEPRETLWRQFSSRDYSEKTRELLHLCTTHQCRTAEAMGYLERNIEIFTSWSNTDLFETILFSGQNICSMAQEPLRHHFRTIWSITETLANPLLSLFILRLSKRLGSLYATQFLDELPLIRDLLRQANSTEQRSLIYIELAAYYNTVERLSEMQAQELLLARTYLAQLDLPSHGHHQASQWEACAAFAKHAASLPAANAPTEEQEIPIPASIQELPIIQSLFPLVRTVIKADNEYRFSYQENGMDLRARIELRENVFSLFIRFAHESESAPELLFHANNELAREIPYNLRLRYHIWRDDNHWQLREKHAPHRLVYTSANRRLQRVYDQAPVRWGLSNERNILDYDCLYISPASGPNERVFHRLNLRFIQDEQPNTSWSCEQYPDWKFTPNTRCDLLGSYQVYYVLQQENRFKILLPLFEGSQEIRMDPLRSLSIVDFAPNQSNLRHFFLDIDDHGDIIPDSRESAFFIAQILMNQHNYTKAAQYLRRFGNKLTEYTQLEEDRLLALANTTDPDAPYNSDQLTISLFSALLLGKYKKHIDRKPKYIKTIKDLYSNYLNRLQHVTALRLTKEEEMSLLALLPSPLSSPFLFRLNTLNPTTTISPISSIAQPDTTANHVNQFNFRQFSGIPPVHDYNFASSHFIQTFNHFQSNFWYYLNLARTGTTEQKHRLSILLAAHKSQQHAGADLLLAVLKNPQQFEPLNWEQMGNSQIRTDWINSTAVRRYQSLHTTSTSPVILNQTPSGWHPPAVIDRPQPRFLMARNPESLPQEILDLANRAPEDPFRQQQYRLTLSSEQTRMINTDDILVSFGTQNSSLLTCLNPHLSQNDIATIYNGADRYLRRQHSRNYQPAYLVFEYYSNMVLRKNQIQFLQQLLESEQPNPVFLEAIMGSGKTAVLAPLIGVLRADGKQLSLIVVPEPLLSEISTQMQSRLASVFHNRLHLVSFNRNIECSQSHLRALYHSLQSAIVNRQCVITTDHSLQALLLKYIELCDEHMQQDRPFGVEIELLHNILSLLRTSSYPLFDEVDTIFDLRHELNFSVGLKVPIAAPYVKAIGDIYELLFTDEQLKRIARIETDPRPDGSAPPLTLTLYRTQLLPILAEKMSLQLQQIPEFAQASRAHVLAYLLRDATLDRETQELFSNLSHLNQDILALISEQLNNILPQVLLDPYNIKYGLDQAVYAVPFTAANTPCAGSEFANCYVTANYTFQIYWKQRLQNKDIRNLIDLLIRQAKEESRQYDPPRPLQDTNSYRLFLGIRGDNLIGLSTHITDAHIDILIERLEQRENAPLKRQVIERCFISQIKTFSERLSCNPIILAGLFKRFSGFTGTLWITRSLHAKIQTLPDQTIIPTTMRLLEQMQTECNRQAQRFCITVQTAEVDEMLDSIVENAPAFSMIADAGGLFKDIDNTLLAHRLKMRIPQRQVVHFDKTNSLLIASQDLPDRPFDRTRDLPHSRMTFLDQNHTTGADVPQAPDAIGLITIGRQITQRTLLQAVWRMRGLSTGQSVRFIIDSDTRHIILTQLNLQANTEITLEHIDQFAQHNQKLRIDEDAISAFVLQNNLFGQELALDILADPTISNAERKRRFAQVRSAWFQSGNIAPRVLYGTFAKSITREQFLGQMTQERESSLQRMREWAPHMIHDVAEEITRLEEPTVTDRLPGSIVRVIHSDQTVTLQSMQMQQAHHYTNPIDQSIKFTYSQIAPTISLPSLMANFELLNRKLKSINNEVHHCFESIWVSPNFLGEPECNPTCLFNKYALPFLHLLIQGDRVVLLSAIEAEALDDKLLPLYYCLTSGFVNDPTQRLTPNALLQVAQLKFLNGDVEYTQREMQVLQHWLQRSGPRRMLAFFTSTILNTDEKRRRFEQSHLNQWFQETIRL